MKEYTGIAASPGIRQGTSVCYRQPHFVPKVDYATDILKEHTLLKNTLAEVKKDLQSALVQAEQTMGKEDSAVFEAHQVMLEDPELLESIADKINTGQSAFNSVYHSFAEFMEIFSKMDSEYMRERSKDLKDIRNQVLLKMEGKTAVDLSQLPDDTILLADDLLPGDTAKLDPAKVRGFITLSGGKTGHIAIMARSLGIPAIVGVGEFDMAEGLSVIMDGEQGRFFLSPDDPTIKYYQRLAKEAERERASLVVFADKPSQTATGKPIDLAANIGNPKDLTTALTVGAEGIGLFRTEFLFMDRTVPPTEEEQTEAYATVLSAFPNHRVVIRTLDIGGDKQIPYLDFPEEENPFLGYRAIRYCLDHPDLFKTQLRALLRASSHGRLAIMIPMIATLDEVRSVKSLYQEVKQELHHEKLSYSSETELGIMIEIPQAALIADILAKEVDFFSIGTNDLIQYSLAADRLNPDLAELYSAYQPGPLRLIASVAEAAHKQGIWIGICGEAGADPALLPFWLSLGLDELSMSASSLLKIRSLTANLDERKLAPLKKEILAAGDKETVAEILGRWQS